MINLMTWRETKQRRQHYWIAIRLSIITMLMLMLVVIIHNCLDKETQHLIRQSTEIQNRIKKIILPITFSKDAVLLKNITRLYPEKIKSINQNNNTIYLLHAIDKSIPNSITLSTLQLTQTDIAITGQGNLLSDLHSYTDVLQKHLANYHVQLSTIKRDSTHPSIFHFMMRIST